MRKTEGRDLEIRRFMDMIEKSLTGMNMIITLLNQKMDKVNKAVKWLKEG
jgi:hypothetical protein